MIAKIHELNSMKIQMIFDGQLFSTMSRSEAVESAITLLQDHRELLKGRDIMAQGDIPRCALAVLAVLLRDLNARLYYFEEDEDTFVPIGMHCGPRYATL